MLFRHPATLPRVVTVDQPHPHAPSVAYTEGPWEDIEHGLVTFARAAEVGADLLRAVGRLPVACIEPDGWVAMNELERGAIVRFSRCEPTTLDRFLHARTREGSSAPYLQVTVVHTDRRLDERLGCDCCPNLAWSGDELHSSAFSVPGWTIGNDVRLLPTTTAAEVIAVDVPVLVDEEPAFRHETLLAERVSGGVRLLQSPVIADWTVAGAVMELSGPPYGVGPPRARAVEATPRHIQLGVALERSGWVSEHRGAVDDVVASLVALGGVAVSRTGWWLSVSVPERHAERARSALRRLVRDGHAHEVGSYSRPASGRCDCCVAGRGV